MTTTMKLHVGGKFVADVQINGLDQGSVGPNEEKSFGIKHNEVTSIVITERAATDDADAGQPVPSETPDEEDSDAVA